MRSIVLFPSSKQMPLLSRSAHRTNAFLIVAKRATRDVDNHAKLTTIVATALRAHRETDENANKARGKGERAGI